MKARRLSLVFSLALAVAPAMAYAQGHGHSGGSGGGGHASSGGGHAVPRGQGSGASTPQGRHPQAGTGTGYRYGYGHGYHGHGHYGYGYGHGYYPYYPYYGYGYGYGYGYPYWGWGGSIGFYYGGGPYYDGYYGGGYSDGGYAGGGYSNDGPYSAPYSAAPGSVRLLVDPEDTKVYVDGYYSGVVDDYDGMGQHLDLPPGKHEIALRLDGYQSQRFKVYVSPDNTLKIHYTMVKGTGEAPQEIVVGDPSAEQYSHNERRRYDDDRMAADRPQGDRYGDDHPSDRSHVRLGTNDRPPSSRPRDEGATLRLRIKPEDASVYVDGRFYGTARDSARLDLAPGRHRIEIVRPGYHTYDNEVEVGGDAPTDLDVTLER